MSDSKSIGMTTIRLHIAHRGNHIYAKLDTFATHCIHHTFAGGMMGCESCRWLAGRLQTVEKYTLDQVNGHYDVSIKAVKTSGKLSDSTKEEILKMTDAHFEAGAQKAPEKKERSPKETVGNLSSIPNDFSMELPPFVPPPFMVSEPAAPTGSVKGKGKVVETATAPKFNPYEKFASLKTKIVSCQVSDLQIYPPGSKEIEVYGKDYLSYLASLALYAELVSERKTFQLTKTKNRAKVAKAEKAQAKKLKATRVRIVDGGNLVPATKKLENLEKVKEAQAKARRRIKKAKYRARKSAEKVKKVTEKNLEVLKAVKVTQKLTKVLKRTDENLGWTVVGKNGKPVKVVKAGKVKQQSQSGGLNQNKNLSIKPTVSKTSSVGIPTEVAAGS